MLPSWKGIVLWGGVGLPEAPLRDRTIMDFGCLWLLRTVRRKLSKSAFQS